MPWKQIPCSIYRGGTSKGLFVRGRDLPDDPVVRDHTILSLFGSPDPKQIDGLGGATPTTSKFAIVETSKREDADVDYTFAQVSIDRPYVDYRPNCGNISSAVGPFAVHQGMVQVPATGMAEVRIYNTNTNSIIVSRFEVKDGEYAIEGNTEIPGVPGSGAPVYLDFFDEGGGVTGRLFPTGSQSDVIELSDGTTYHVTVIDVGNLTIIIDGTELGFSGTEVSEEQIEPMLAKMESVRVKVGQMLGLFREGEAVSPTSHALPKVAVVGVPESYQTTSGKWIEKQDYTIAARVLTMGKLHPTYAVTGGIALSASCQFPGTIGYQKCIQGKDNGTLIRIGHPAGILEMDAEFAPGHEPKMKRITLVRTARPLMEGQAVVPDFGEVMVSAGD